jgi:hypothetical protein
MLSSVAWKSYKKNGGIGRASINHYTADNKKTLCNKDIPGTGQAHCYDAFGPTDCTLCLSRKSLAEDSMKKASEKPAHFKKIVEEHGGHYECNDGVHSAWWDDKKNLYIAYGRLTPMVSVGDSLSLTENWLHFKPKDKHGD